MAFQVRQEIRPNTIGRDPTLWMVENDAGERLEIWPAMGFNAYRWAVGGAEILYRDPAFFDEVKPTRSGWPILFPFPNRIRDGRFVWYGADYQLPLNDPSGKNAIHGFVATRPWRVIQHGTTEDSAWITAEIRSTLDLAEVRHLWPGDYRLAVTYRLRGDAALEVEALIENVGATDLPFGLGYHPYFRVAPFGGDQAIVQLPSGRRWHLDDCLPSGMSSVIGNTEHMYTNCHLDDLIGDLPKSASGLRECGAIRKADGGRLEVAATLDFRELVVFTPPHRQAICFEPYTCTTDAINLQQAGNDVGLLTLAPSASWSGSVQVKLLRR